MAHPDYNRRGYSPVAPSVYTANSNDYTSGYGTQQDTYNPLNRPAGGPKPLDWHVGGATAPNAQGPSRSSEPAYWSTTSTGPGALNTNYNYAATGSDTATTADAAFSARSYPQKQQSGAASAGPIPAYAGTRLGPEIAGYKSVLTKNPVSPSGYSLAAPPQQQPSPAGKQRSSTSAISHNPQHSQQPRTPAATQEVDPAKRSAAAAVAALAALGSNRTKSPDKSAGSTGSNISRPSSIRYGSPAGGGYANTTNIDSYSNGASDGYPAEDMYGYAGRGGYPAASAAEGPAALQWKLPAGAGSGTFTPPAAHSPVAGRRAAAAPANAGSYAPSSNRSTNEDTLEGYIPSNAPGLRPPSQQRTEGLSKLKQLASARMACRISTPPTEDLIHPAAPATAPTVGRRSSGGYGAAARAPVQADRGALDLQQQRQQHQQRDPWQHSQDYNPSTYTDYQYQPAASNAAPSSGRRSAVRQAVTARSRMPPQLQQNGEVEDTPMRAAGGARAFGGYNLDAALAADGSAPLQGDTASEQCPSCGRKFTATAFDRHVGICDKVFGQKRKVGFPEITR